MLRAGPCGALTSSVGVHSVRQVRRGVDRVTSGTVLRSRGLMCGSFRGVDSGVIGVLHVDC
jgi:hypothetical protein